MRNRTDLHQLRVKLLRCTRGLLAKVQSTRRQSGATYSAETTLKGKRDAPMMLPTGGHETHRLYYLKPTA